MSAFVTVKEAARLTGKSTSSIRRIIYPIIEKDHHIDRHHIQPSVKEALRLRVKGQNFAWRVSEELLRRAVPIVEKTAPEQTEQRSSKPNDDGLVGMLRRELDIKNGQISQQGELINKQMELINGLSERLREGNVLIGSLQQHLALSDGKQTRGGIVVAAEAEPKTKQSSADTPKRRWFSRMFHS